MHIFNQCTYYKNDNYWVPICRGKNISKTGTTTQRTCTFCSVNICASYDLCVATSNLFLRAFYGTRNYFNINILYCKTGATKTRPRDDDNDRDGVESAFFWRRTAREEDSRGKEAGQQRDDTRIYRIMGRTQYPEDHGV